MSPARGDDSWEREIREFIVDIERAPELLVPIAQACHESITIGSPITGAPGQPVGQYGPGYHPGRTGGTLLASYQLEFPDAETARITSNLEYAEPIEDGVGPHGPLTLRSSVGGFHSVAHTEQNFDRLVDHVAAEHGL